MQATQTSPSDRFFLICIIFIITVGQISTDIYLPSLPDMTREFQTASTLLQNTLTLYLISFGLSQLFYGPLSDRFGRRNILFLGMFIYSIGTTICALAAEPYTLIAGRLIQGAGIGAGAVIARAMSRDRFDGHALAKVSAYIGMAMSLSPALAPSVGGLIHDTLGWRANFIALLLYTFILLIIFVRFLPETHAPVSGAKHHLRQVLRNYKKVLSHRLFLALVCCPMLAFSCFMAYQGLAPYLLQNKLGLTAAQSGASIIFIALGYTLGTFCHNHLLKYFRVSQLMPAGAVVMLCAGLLMLLLSLTQPLSLLVLIAPMVLFVAGAGLVNPGALAGMLSPFPQMAATASAAMGCLIMLGAGLGSFVVAVLPDNSQIPLAILLCINASIILTVILRYIIPRMKTEPDVGFEAV